MLYNLYPTLPLKLENEYLVSRSCKEYYANKIITSFLGCTCTALFPYFTLHFEHYGSDEWSKGRNPIENMWMVANHAHIKLHQLTCSDCREMKGFTSFPLCSHAEQYNIKKNYIRECFSHWHGHAIRGCNRLSWFAFELGWDSFIRSHGPS